MTDNQTYLNEPTLEEKLFAVLSYFFVTVLAVLVMKKESQFCMYHAKNGIALSVLEVSWLIVATILMIFVEFLGILVVFLGLFAFFGAHLYGIIMAITGDTRDIPLLNAVTKKMNVEYFSAFITSHKQIDTKTTTQEPEQQSQAVQTEQTQTSTDNHAIINDNQSIANSEEPHAFGFRKNGKDMVAKAVENVKK